MNFGNIFSRISSTVQTRPGIRVPAPIEHRQTFHVPSPVRLRLPVKSLPVMFSFVPKGTHEVTTIIHDQRANPGVFEFVPSMFRRAKK